MPNREYSTDNEESWEAIDSAAWFGLEEAFEANREFKATGSSERYALLVDWAGKVIGPESLGEKSLYITEPELANMKFAHTQD